MCSDESPANSSSATAHAASAVSRLIVCSRMPKRICLPRACASSRTAAIFAAAACGGSPHVRYTSTCSAAMGSAAGDEPPK